MRFARRKRHGRHVLPETERREEQHLGIIVPPPLLPIPPHRVPHKYEQPAQHAEHAQRQEPHRHLPEGRLHGPRIAQPLRIWRSTAQQRPQPDQRIPVRGDAVQLDGLRSGEQDGGQREEEPGVPAGADGPGLAGAIVEDVGPGAGGGQAACYEGALTG